jgi:hypothetical protein
MHIMIRHFAAAMLASLLAAAAPALAQAEVTNAPDPYLHRGTGVQFPAVAGPFRRGRVNEFNAQGTDVGIGYKAPVRGNDMTVYIYPGSVEACKKLFDSAVYAVRDRAGVSPRKDAVPLRLLAKGIAEQHSATFTIPPGGYGSGHPELVSYVWVGCTADNKWAVKYRGSFLATDEAEAGGFADELFAAIDWSPLIGR